MWGYVKTARLGTIDSMSKTTHEQYIEMIAAACTAALAYYQDAGLLMADGAYDQLLATIKEYEDAHPDDVVAHSLFSAVAGGVAQSGDAVHASPMLSLDNCFDADALRDWLGARGCVTFTTEPKYDGLSLAATYRQGRLVRIATRGDGAAGENVTHAAGRIVGLPNELSEALDIEVRGEVIFTHDDYQAANDARVLSGKKAFVNPRNAAAGTLRAENLDYAVRLSFFAHGHIGLDSTSHSEAMTHLQDLGFGAGEDQLAIQTHSDVDSVIAAVDAFSGQRLTLPLDADGIVIKCDQISDQERLGFSSRAPRWGIAFKYPALEATSVLRMVEWTVGRTGRITPRASIDPVFVAGTTVTYATLHNANDIKRKDLRIGDTVLVKRAGEVIPRIEAPIVEKRTGAETIIQAPEHCPRCAAPLDTSDLVWRCTRGRSCGAAEAIRYAASRECLDIEGMGDKLVEQLVEAKLVSDVADLFSLTVASLSGLDRMGDTSARKVIDQIAQAKSQPLSRVFCALGVRMTGRSMSRRLARHFLTMAALRTATIEDLTQVDGVGPERAATIREELSDLSSVIERLEAMGVNMTEAPAGAIAAESDIAGKTFVLTGAMSGPLEALSRNDVHALIEGLGAKTSSSVSKKTDYLVCGESSGSKLDKAKTLGVRIISPEDLAALLGR